MYQIKRVHNGQIVWSDDKIYKTYYHARNRLDRIYDGLSANCEWYDDDSIQCGKNGLMSVHDLNEKSADGGELIFCTECNQKVHVDNVFEFKDQDYCETCHSKVHRKYVATLIDDKDPNDRSIYIYDGATEIDEIKRYCFIHGYASMNSIGMMDNLDYEDDIKAHMLEMEFCEFVFKFVAPYYGQDFDPQYPENKENDPKSWYEYITKWCGDLEEFEKYLKGSYTVQDFIDEHEDNK